jgi:hypothetical protein
MTATKLVIFSALTLFSSRAVADEELIWSLEPRTSPFPCEIFVLTEEGGYKFSQPLHILCHENDVFRFSPIRPIRSTDISAYCGQSSLFKNDALVFFALSDKTRLHPGNLIEVMREDCQKLDDHK